MTVLLDSWAWIEYLKDSPVAEKIEPYLSGAGEIIISTINIAEIKLFMLREKKENILPYIIERCFVVPVTESIAKLAAEIKHEKKMSLADALILATAREHSSKVITGDPDFKNIRDAIVL